MCAEASADAAGQTSGVLRAAPVYESQDTLKRICLSEFSRRLNLLLTQFFPDESGEEAEAEAGARHQRPCPCRCARGRA